MEKNIKIKLLLKNIFLRKIDYNQYNVISLGFLGAIGHPLFWFIWTYLNPQKFENIYLRLSGTIICLVLLSSYFWKGKIRKIIQPYWIFSIIYNLPFIFTLSLIQNDYNSLWLIAEATMIFTVVLTFGSFIYALMILFIGGYFAILASLTIFPTSSIFDTSLYQYLPLILYILSTAAIFGYSSVMGISVSKDVENRKSLNIVKALAGSIAHELRNPLNSIILLTSNLKTSVKELIKTNPKKTYQEIEDHQSLVKQTIILANEIIDMTLLELSGKKLNKDDFLIIDAKKSIIEAMAIYGFRNIAEKQKVKFDLEKDFKFLGSETVFKYILFNLIKNALYYLKEYPKSVITVGSEFKCIDGKDYNIIYIHDTGPGIPSNVIPKLFGDFYTSGKKEGTGLGLAFCKRNMQSFGGDIVCDSELNEWTKFGLLFPVIEEADIKELNKIAKPRILIVDDEKTNLLVTKAKIEKNSEFVCDIVENGLDAIEITKKNNYKLVIMDIQMPVMNGIEAANKIKRINQNIPIIALTSLSYEELDLESRVNFDFYLKKPIEGHILHRTIFKLTMSEDSLDYIGDESQYLPHIKDKRVLLVDDQDINRMITSKKLTSSGMVVDQASDGKELVEKFQCSLGKPSEHYDIILTDIHMNELNGDAASRAIRKIEQDNDITYCNQIPIIALSGDGQKKDIDNFFAHEMTDYFIKGNSPENLIKIIATYLSHGVIFKSSPKNKPTKKEDDRSTNYFSYDKLRFFSKPEKEEFIETFITDSNRLFYEVVSNYKEKNFEELSLELHALKGIIGNLGATALYDSIVELEKVVKVKDNLEISKRLKISISHFKQLRKELLNLMSLNKSN